MTKVRRLSEYNKRTKENHWECKLAPLPTWVKSPVKKELTDKFCFKELGIKACASGNAVFTLQLIFYTCHYISSYTLPVAPRGNTSVWNQCCNPALRIATCMSSFFSFQFISNIFRMFDVYPWIYECSQRRKRVVENMFFIYCLYFPCTR